MSLSKDQGHFIRAFRAFGESRLEHAHREMNVALSLCPSHLVYQYAVRHIEQVMAKDTTDVYEIGTAFAAFINGGGNVELYDATVQSLRRVYESYAQLRLLDVGAGDGKALLPALTPNVQHVDVLEPSEAMLAKICEALKENGTSFQSWSCTLQEFVREATEQQWDVSQATFSMHNIEPDERIRLLHWLSKRCPRFLLVEFDVPDFSGRFTEDRILYLLQRYQIGLAEYNETQEEVALGFLMPIMFGQSMYESPVKRWEAEFKEAGYTQVKSSHLYPYWWADAYLIEAQVAGNSQ